MAITSQAGLCSMVLVNWSVGRLVGGIESCQVRMGHVMSRFVLNWLCLVQPNPECQCRLGWIGLS